MIHEKKDWFGNLMSVRRELNEPHIAYFGQANIEKNEIQKWHQIDHCNSDGIGGFVTILRQLGHIVERVPGDHTPPPPAFKRPWLFLKSLIHTYQRQIKWKVPYNPKNRHYGIPELYWHVFNKDETRQIKRKALKSRASVNSLLLSTLNNIIAPELVDSSIKRFHWMVPTNLRGALKQEDDLANHCSTLSIDVEHQTTAEFVQKRFRELSRNADDWSFHWSVKLMGLTMPRKFFGKFQQNFEKQNPYIGCLTNIGEWHANIPHQETNLNEAWVVVPTINQTNPVGAGTITWNGQLSIALYLHPALELTPETTQTLLDLWKKELIN